MVLYYERKVKKTKHGQIVFMSLSRSEAQENVDLIPLEGTSPVSCTLDNKRVAK